MKPQLPLYIPVFSSTAQDTSTSQKNLSRFRCVKVEKTGIYNCSFVCILRIHMEVQILKFYNTKILITYVHFTKDSVNIQVKFL